MALQLLPILQVIIILCSPTTDAYPVFGTKRYGRGTTAHRSWNAQLPYQQMVRTQRYPVNYYEMYPYTQNYADDHFYSQDPISYPYYYPPARTSKYEVYQAVLPYYYPERPAVRPYTYYAYDNTDGMVDLDDDLARDIDREEKEESQPIGQEMFYENDSTNTDDSSIDDVNAAFLQNLIMTQMYSNNINKDSTENFYDDGKWDDVRTDDDRQGYFNEDEDVKELKQLAQPQNLKNKHIEMRPTTEERLHWFQKGSNKKTNDKKYEATWGNTWEAKRASPNDIHGKHIYGIADRKAATKNVIVSPSSTEKPSTTLSPKREAKGQKEEVLLRPATPVRHPFSTPVLDLLSKNEIKRERTPSVYDTIKHMLDMEKDLENNYVPDEVKPSMRKRIISSEDSLSRQLSILKKQ